ncbi:endonuclease [Sphingobium amiense]|uniref:Endonuclease n=1 Tax=Sphingobium amiense TaxID=135719 RepID=A0A494WBK9_9SPHN|nr:endonuclease/exonuclease/phosphatase family protein [Sphingobium amiense]BBE00088.1 endonuclease [Sphingobium amiense]
MRRLSGTVIFAAMVALASSGSGREEARRGWSPPQTAAVDPGALSVMTYNVEGLPWPVARGRGEMLERIAARLRTMRQAGRQPHVVLLQEAFSAEAQALARSAGYAHVAMGPDASLRTPLRADAADTAFMAQARWAKGEDMGKQVGSGLMILSDYPIVGTDRMAYPDFACAGYDCLANKGVLIAHLSVPGAGVVSVVDTHLNSRAATGVSVARANRAYQRQITLMAQFVRAAVPGDRALVIGGDMNLGHDPRRLAAFFDGFSGAGLRFITPAMSGTYQALASGGRTRDLVRAARHAKDWLFARASDGEPMRVAGAEVPFGSEPDGGQLSDHMGYVIRYARPAPGGVRLASNELRAAR